MTAASERYHHIKYRRPWLYEKQLRAIFSPLRFSVIEASTKSGKTVGCLAWILEQALRLKPGDNVWWVAPVYGQSDIAFTRMKAYLPDELYKANATKMNMTLRVNGAVIWFKSGEKPDNLYGEDVHAAVLDEATRMREEAWQAVRTTLTATRGPARIIGNVKGRKNWAFKLARKAEQGRKNWGYFKLTCQDAVDAGILDPEEIEEARHDLPEAVFRELYWAEPTEDGSNPFGVQHIAACVAPMEPGPAAAYGWDLAKSIDWTVGIGLNHRAYTCDFHRFQMPWEETLRAIRKTTGKVPADVDSTGVGDPIAERLARGSSNFHGFNFSGGGKQKLMEGLAVGIQSGEVHYPDGVIRQELEQYEFVYTRAGGVKYEAPEGYFDDCVCSLALAYHRWKEARRTGQIFV